MLSLWRRFPVVVRAVLTGSVLGAVGTTPWAVLVSANSKYWSAVPWAVPPTALYLWLFWRYVQGAGWPRSTAEARRTNCRANRLSEEVWGAALFAGGLGLVALVLFLGVMNRLVRLPSQPTDDLTHIPFVTLVPWLLMSAVVAGIAEESSFRLHARTYRAASRTGGRDPGDRKPVWIRSFHASRGHTDSDAVLPGRRRHLWCFGIPDELDLAERGTSRGRECLERHRPVCGRACGVASIVEPGVIDLENRRRRVVLDLLRGSPHRGSRRGLGVRCARQRRAESTSTCCLDLRFGDV